MYKCVYINTYICVLVCVLVYNSLEVLKLYLIALKLHDGRTSPIKVRHYIECLLYRKILQEQLQEQEARLLPEIT